jgi:hypothetical protein
VVPPDGHVGDQVNPDAELVGELRDRAVVVQPHHGREALLGQVGSVRHRDQGVGVGRVADNQHLHVGRSPLLDRLPLGLEDLPVGLQQVSALHPLGPRASADQEGDVGVVEGVERLV